MKLCSTVFMQLSGFIELNKDHVHSSTVYFLSVSNNTCTKFKLAQNSRYSHIQERYSGSILTTV